jgi:hypothetical protein
VLVAHLDIPLDKHVGIIEVLRALNVVLALLLNKGGLDIWVDSQLKELTLVSLKS